MSYPPIPQAIKAWKTTDGKIHEDEGLAKLHEAHLSVMHDYSNNPIYADGGRVNWDDLTEWVKENPSLAINVFSTLRARIK